MSNFSTYGAIPGGIQLARWATCLISHGPMNHHDFVRIYEDLEQAVHDNKEWAVTSLGAVISDLARSLASNDAWRDATIVNGVAMLDGRRFGSATDFFDLFLPVSADLSEDEMLCVVENPIPAGAAKAIVLGFVGRTAVEDLLEDLSAAAITVTATEAIRFLHYRRQVQRGGSEGFALEAAWWWAEQAHAIVSGVKNASQDADKMDRFRIPANRIPDRRYTPRPEWVEEREKWRRGQEGE